MSSAKKIAGPVARLAPSKAAKAVASSVIDAFADGVAFITQDRAIIFSTPVREMEDKAIIATFCVLKRTHAAIDRRLKIVRQRIDELFEQKGIIQPGESGRVLEAGAFKVSLDNTNANKTVVDVTFLKKLCDDRKIPWDDVTDYIPPMPATGGGRAINNEKVRALLAAKLITEKQLGKCFVPAPVKPEVNVTVPDVVERVIEKQLLGDINTEKLPKKEK